MEKGLVKKIVPYVFAGLGLIGGGCAKTYNIDRSKVTDYGEEAFFIPVQFISMKEKTDSCVIRYFKNPQEFKKIKVRSAIDIFSPMNNTYKSSNPEDSAVIRCGEERYYYLNNKIDSIKESERQQKIAIKEAKKQKRINFGLRALRR
jgi:hypothetical protein